MGNKITEQQRTWCESTPVVPDDTFAAWMPPQDKRFRLNVFRNGNPRIDVKKWYHELLLQIRPLLTSTGADVWVDWKYDSWAAECELNLYDMLPTTTTSKTELRRLMVALPVNMSALQTAYDMPELTDLSLHLIPTAQDNLKLGRFLAGWREPRKLVHLSITVGNGPQMYLLKDLAMFIKMSASTLQTLRLRLLWCKENWKDVMGILDGDVAFPVLSALSIRIDRYVGGNRLTDDEAVAYSRQLLRNRSQTLRRIVVDLSQCTDGKRACWQSTETKIRALSDMDLPQDSTVRWLKPDGRTLCVVGRNRRA